ncbi:thymidylate kinase-domain-containing protein [Blyttiomyces helicus]|uniref:Thymidylate kinase n=1 Tax=Blyttiomyces helicus TaxID=388810 RepID=A0A4P9VYV5_9FUNG|nr:thymidylate kinase-domain-containing protein [Blyttiomyces helicus]|eukprot:RKO84979.1 thymidylate kinase-domain-containing protein [Blyttiomyces helicus]
MVRPGRGALIVFEGGDRSGKSTQCRLLLDALRAAGLQAQLRRFPDRTTATGKLIDEYLKGQSDVSDEAVHLLFSANRWEAMAAMKRDLMDGMTLVVDRYAYSGVAYTAAKGLSLSWCQQPDVGLIQPDAVMYMELSSTAAAARADFGGERYEKVEFQEKVRGIFQQLKDPWWKVSTVQNAGE